MAPRGHRRQMPQQSGRVLAFIKSEIAAGNPWPRSADVARYMGWKGCSPVRDAIARLVRRGLVAETSRQEVAPHKYTYTYRLTDEAKT